MTDLTLKRTAALWYARLTPERRAEVAHFARTALNSSEVAGRKRKELTCP